jgi:hypothetical protein
MVIEKRKFELNNFLEENGYIRILEKIRNEFENSMKNHILNNNDDSVEKLSRDATQKEFFFFTYL